MAEPPTGALSQEAEAAHLRLMRQSKLDGEALSEAVVGSLEREVVEREEEKRRRVAQDVTKPVLE
jgi:hypothetical protein